MSLSAAIWPPVGRSEDDPVLWFHLNGGGSLAAFGESPRQFRSGLPWLAIHGGPGGRINSSLVAPLRRLGLRWFGMDQRCGGQSEDAHLEDIDLQRLVDDQFALLDHLQIARCRVLAGSWGATLALAMAVQRPERIASMVLRAPFLPFRSRVDTFFEHLRLHDEVAFDEIFASANVAGVCGIFDVHVPESTQLKAAHLWSHLELKLLTDSGGPVGSPPKLESSQAEALLRKYRLQSHFLRHDCFWSLHDFESDMLRLRAEPIPVTVVQGEKDKVCPPDGAQWLLERLPSIQVLAVPDAGHLAGDVKLARVIEGEVRVQAGV